MTDRDRKRKLKKAFKEAERAAELQSCPLDVATLRALVEAVEWAVHDQHGNNLCDRTLRLTRSRLEARGGEDIEAVIAFLQSKGGDCDCEAAANLGSWLAWNAPGGARHR
jgi:hypothetical protein